MFRFLFISVEMHGGINNFSNVLGANGGQILKNIQALIATNPSYLTHGIPTHLIQQMWNNDATTKVEILIFFIKKGIYLIRSFHYRSINK